MNFRIKAFALHLAGSATLLTLVLGALWLGWYRWPGWYLTQVSAVAAIMVGVDVVLGPILTATVANPRKSRRELTRDIGVIVCCQLIALAYGSWTLWQGRPLYYAFSVDRMQLVQASDISPAEWRRAQRENAPLAPHWYSMPRYVWAPLPSNPAEADAIVRQAIGGGEDVIQMPRYFRPWNAALPEIRKRLGTPDGKGMFAPSELRSLAMRMHAAGFADEASTLILEGRSRPLIAVFDPDTLAIRGFIGLP